MSLLIFTLIVVVLLVLAVWAVQSFVPVVGLPPGSPLPKNLLCLLLVAIAIVAIAQRAHLF